MSTGQAYSRAVNQRRRLARAISEKDMTTVLAVVKERDAARRAEEARERQRRVDEWYRQWKRDFERQQRQRAHETTLAQIRSNMAANRRRKEQAIIDDRRAALAIYRDLRTRYGKPVPEHLIRFEMRQCVETHCVPDTQVLQCRDHLLDICRREGIEVSWDALPAVNAYAWHSLRRVECPVVRTKWGVAAFAHEIGHVLKPTTDDKGTDGKKVSVQSELAAWRWAMGNTLVWDKQMHRCLYESLNTYRKYATPEEASEMDDLTSPLAVHRERQRRAMVGVPPEMALRRSTNSELLPSYAA